MSENEKFLLIKKLIDRMDYDDLLAGGAPSDEFDSESKEISKRVRFDHSVPEIADIIASVFNEAFDEHNTSAVFLPIAEMIQNRFIS